MIFYKICLFIIANCIQNIPSADPQLKFSGRCINDAVIVLILASVIDDMVGLIAVTWDTPLYASISVLQLYTYSGLLQIAC